MISQSTTDFASAPFEIIDGDRGKNYPKQNEFFDRGHCLFLSATNVTRTGFNFFTCQFITEQKDEVLRKGKLQREDVVLTTRGTIGNVAYYTATVPYEHLRINSGMVILRCDPSEILPAYLYHFLRSPQFHGQVNSLRSGVAQPQLPIRDMKRIKLPLPHLSIQKAIVSVLSAYDDLIENNRRRIQLLEQAAWLLYKEWFVHLRFPGHEHVSMRDGVPEGWERKSVSELVQRIPAGKLYSQKSASDKGRIPILDQGKSGLIGFHDDEPSVVASQASPVIVFANHTCYQRIIHYPFSAIQNVLPFIPAADLSRNIYWLHHATDGLVNINAYKGHWPEFMAKQVLLPPRRLCNHFGQMSRISHLMIHRLEEQSKLLAEARDLLLPRLMNGEIPV